MSAGRQSHLPRIERSRPEPAPAPDPATTADQIRRYGETLWRQKLLIVLCVAMAVVGAIVFTLMDAPQFAATTTIIIQRTAAEQVVDPSTLTARDAQRRIDTEIEVLRSANVLEETERRLGHRPQVRVVAVGQTDTVQVIATASDGATAMADANGYAQAYVDTSRARATADLELSKAEAQAKVDETTQRMVQIDDRLAELDALLLVAEPAEKGALQAERRDLTFQQTTQTDQRTYFAQQRDRLEVAASFASRGGAQIIGKASTPDAPISPSLPRNVGVAAVVGLLLGVIAAFFRDQLDDRLKTKDEVQRVDPSFPVIGLIPRFATGVATARPRDGSTRSRSVAAPDSIAAEAYRMVRASLAFMDLGGSGIRVLQVTSSEPGDGKTTTAANLAVAFARTGQRVVAVCCDWRDPRLHECFGLGNGIGFTSVLLGEATSEQAVQPVPGFDNLVVLTSGPLPPNPAELLGTERTRAIVRELAGAADIVIIDTPPVLPVSDAMVLAPIADATIVVTMSGKTSRKGLRQALELLRLVDAPLVGAVLVGVAGGESYGARHPRYGGESDARRSAPDEAELFGNLVAHDRTSAPERPQHASSPRHHAADSPRRLDLTSPIDRW